MTRALWLAALALAIPALAAAEDRPATQPQRDVDVHYQIPGITPGAPPRDQRMRWSVAMGKIRVDPPSGGLYMIVDTQAGRMQVVKPAEQAVLDMAAEGMNPAAAAAGHYTREGAGSVAGLPCTDWQTADTAGRPTTLCLTADGVMLRASEGGQVLVEAASVAYGPQDPAVFVPPASYHHIAPAVP